MHNKESIFIIVIKLYSINSTSIIFNNILFNFKLIGKKITIIYNSNIRTIFKTKESNNYVETTTTQQARNDF